jgi:(p)ppGpp synthase/HD superfamily hydrolase
MDIQTIYQKSIKFAAKKHADINQSIPGTNLPYVVHLCNVAMEVMIASYNSTGFNLEFAIPVALLHDSLEDTETTFNEISSEFGNDVAMAVSALTKNNDLPKDKKMEDSLERIKKLSKEVWSVKIADRITNLQSPPAHWNFEKIQEYKNEATQILKSLEGANEYLEERLKNKIEEYSTYLEK